MNLDQFKLWLGRLIKSPNTPKCILNLLSAQSWVVRSLGEGDVKQAQVFAKGRMLDVGCGWKPYQKHFLPCVSSYVGLEYPTTRSESTVVDIYGSALELPFRDGCFDTILATQVLEHVPAPHQMISEISRVLDTDGYVILTAPHMFFLHEEPHDYFRFTKYALRYLFESSGIEVVYIKPLGGYWISGGTMFSYYLQSGGILRRSITLPMVVCVQLLSKFLDRIDTVETASCNYTAVGRKV